MTELAQLPAQPSQPVQAAHCLNCFHPLSEPRPRFCGHCGQETNVLPPKFWQLLQQFGGAYFSTEGALWRTLALLLFWPGELTRKYRAGRRKHYVLPVRLYITISLLALLLMRIFVPMDWKIGDNMVKTEDQSFVMLDMGNGSRAGLEKGKFFCEKLSPWLCSHLEARFDLDPKTFARELKRVPERFINHWGTAMFLLVPIFALLHKLVYWRRHMRYTEHLVYGLHVHSFWFAALMLALLPVPGVPQAMAVVVPLYTLVAAHRVYGGGWFGTLLRATLVALLYLIILSLALGVVLVWAFFS
jgi:Protein of unknown function (DUF3667)